MARSFAVTAAADVVPLERGRGEATYTVTNAAARPVRGRARLVPLGSARQTWFTVEGEQERDFQTNETHQFSVRIAVPDGSQAGKYSFRLDMVSVTEPDEDFTEAPATAFDYKPQSSARPFPWWIIPVAAGVFLVVGVLVYHFLTTPAAPSPSPPPAQPPPATAKKVPKVVGQLMKDAIATLQAQAFNVAPVLMAVSDKAPGTVLNQVPAPEEELKPGQSAVQLTIEADYVPVPSVLGSELNEARKLAAAVGLGLIVEKHSMLGGSDAEGRGKHSVFDQFPLRQALGDAAPRQTKRGRGLFVELAEKPVDIPDFTTGPHLWSTVAPDLLLKLGMAPVPASKHTGSKPKGTVLSQTAQIPPELTGLGLGNLKALPGTKILIEVEEDDAQVPRLTGMGADEATVRALEAGLRPYFTCARPLGNGPITVQTQDHAPGVILKIGTQINLKLGGVGIYELAPKPPPAPPPHVGPAAPPWPTPPRPPGPPPPFPVVEGESAFPSIHMMFLDANSVEDYKLAAITLP